ncbi:ribonucleotide-diphosphate reductase subunit beta [Aquimarina sp. TRL1]|uniref:ribonucleotide-diphosphate reductase subunit beta n=1 Tax=Aquimarina sp. (strain TRL1) TaxID=2736252 RepID=UPI00158DB0F9|nr:ribonucleotide-diphosphate reductase subunit beta [Aquimarina sp. TRL1]QKX03869.1 ribonucleotide-diphosphate reductase subunit beta [Aquimarina sp. TRL1]
MSIFEERTSYKPFEYPEVLEFVNALNHTYWVHSEVDFTGDIQDFKVELSASEQHAIKNTLLAIAQIEVTVKAFWGKLYTQLPKPEFNGLGSTFAECEFRHSEAYSRLLEVLDLNGDFEAALASPPLRSRVTLLKKYLTLAPGHSKEDFAKSLAVFSLFIENVSLFSQFAIILSFTRFKGLLKNTSNIIAWTSKDEQIHSQAGIYIFNIIRQEYPDFFNEETIRVIQEAAIDSIETEEGILDWIFEQGELAHLPKNRLVAFMKHRVNESLQAIDIPAVFEVSTQEINAMQWFEEEVFANANDDFFAKRPVDYTKHNQSFTANDLF